jgi:hypothetical protein
MIGRFGFRTSHINQIVVVWTVAIKCLDSAARTSFYVPAKDVQRPPRHTAIVARLLICSPIVLLIS